MKRRLCLMLAVLLVGTFASAQARAQLSIMCNVAGAQVFLSGQAVGITNPNLTIVVKPGVYAVRVSNPGFIDFETRVNVGARGASLRVILQPGDLGARNAVPGIVEGGSPAGDTIAPQPAPALVPAPQVLNYDLSIASNIDGADVYINGNAAGKTPFRAQVPAGSYTLQIRAAGYADYSQNIVVGSGPARINATLQSLSFQVSVDANVRGALVFINGQQVGQTPYAAALMPGTYTILVRAPGFLDYQVPLNVNGPQSLNVSLQSATSSWLLRVPEGMYNKDAGPRGLQIWIDGVAQPTSRGQASGQLTAGRHIVRITAGDLAAETQVDVQIGKSYVFEPFLGISVK